MKRSLWSAVVCVVLAGASVARGGYGQAECVGACVTPMLVEVTDLLRGVNIALDQAAVDTCRAFDGNVDGRVTVDELLLGVRNALEGCGPRSASNQCASAPPIITAVDSGGLIISTSIASREATDPTLSCGCAESPRTAWATYTAAADGVLHVRAFGRPTDQALAVLTGDCGATTELACDVVEAADVTVAVPATAGTRYRIQVASPCNADGDGLILNASLCGDGITTDREECDDGGIAADDGCDPQCALEEGDVLDTQSIQCAGGGSLNLFVAPIGQLFIPSATALAGADLMLSVQREYQPQSVTLQLRRDGLGGELLGERTITTSVLPGAAFYHFRFDPPIAVTPGQTYALEVMSVGDNVNWMRRRGEEDCPVVYPGGGGIGNGERFHGEDFIFRTYAAP